MVKINITEDKPNRFELAANILGVAGTLRGLGLIVLSSLDGEVEVCEELYADMEADIAAVGDWVAKDWLRAYGVGEEAAKLRHLDAQVVRETHMPRIGSFWRLRGCPYGFRWVVVKTENTTVSVSISHTERWGHSYHTNEFIEQFEPFPQAKTFVDASLLDKHTGDNWFWNVQMTAEKQRIDKINADTQQKLNSLHPLQEVFDAVVAQVTTGKGQRHGGGEQPFFEQPWFSTTQQVGIGFPLGQAMKKLGETSSKPDAESFETELLGAIAYAAMAYLANKKLAGNS